MIARPSTASSNGSQHRARHYLPHSGSRPALVLGCTLVALFNFHQAALLRPGGLRATSLKWSVPTSSSASALLNISGAALLSLMVL